MDEISWAPLDQTNRRILVKPRERNEVDLACQAEDECTHGKGFFAMLGPFYW